jgi:hypothetical protein
MEGLMANLDEHVVGGVVNSNGSFLGTLVSSLDTTRLAAAINANPGFVRLMIANMDAQGSANMLHGVHVAQGENDIIGRLLAAIHTAGAEGTIASAINANPTFLADMMGGQDPKMLADMINSSDVSGTGNSLLMNLLGPSGLNPVVLAGAMNAHPTMTGQLLANLDPSVISTALNANVNLLPDLLAMLDTRLVTDTMLAGDDHLMKNMSIRCKAKAKVPILGWMTAEGILWTKSASATPP